MQQPLLLSKDALNLKNYFALSDTEILLLITEFRNFIEFLDSSAFMNYYCGEFEAEMCSGYRLAVLQMRNSYITANPPSGSGIDPTDSICDTNSTCLGKNVEMGAFYHKVFRKEHPEYPQDL